ncbi:3-keto-disaccharide hydrolase [Flagellimonas flava]|uniref:3-keto-alpha-glucoside-1,2-lyase/3-keto-2-hydroxy-glucal hydratase domain-containing protein n=1 Tax=Flagellimonas flava TaxID=570519 RepID=A0A1M5IU45_9FLAO|nr:DUF1080 domain-containing protein [Allomuricauda flava]SHG31539.1 protein of unknown function [Allomuricauda flava]
MRISLLLFTLCCGSFFSSNSSMAQDQNPLEGRWDLEMEFQGKEEPSWLEIRHSGHNTLVGRFVFAFGSARPISEVKGSAEGFSFSIPRQWEPEGNDMKFEGKMVGEELKGTMIYTDGSTSNWTGVKQPKLPFTENPEWTDTINLFNGTDLNGWHTDGDNQWVVREGILTSPKQGANLISDQKFMDFKLKTEFRYPEGSNSGIYLRGRYEVQIADNKGLDPMDIYFGGIYGFLEPNENAAEASNEWQSYEITLIGSRVTIVANGKTIIQNQTIPGITGGAIDSKEGEPGSFMIQGDHGPVEFRKFEVTPMKASSY